ncbi:lysine-2,3-aminomutase-related protein [Methylocaldum marinum]|uniref:L-lysine 2,3-aminomutase n=1 Tax=Methylocaldum marinum TaxID=1432792 RepID=A0A250KNE6_9GAMM|nr:EF-P beta-lysylation protein EpmB [Methylocaldum marinum]BBA33220.1 lysine-2,3-aminomutase-related protein [Methylocaldum marinum]
MKTSWQMALADSFTKPADLLAFLELDEIHRPEFRQATDRFSFRVTQSYAQRMAKGNPHDPLLLQVLPDVRELIEHPNFANDPVGDLKAAAAPGVLQKYQGRILLITTGACAIHCRYCFRRNFPYDGNAIGKQQEQNALDVIRRDRTLNEVIFSGGDPLVLSDERLGQMIRKIGEIPHIRRLRIHTRLPIVLPCRITTELIAALTATHLNSVIVIHANHPNEFNHEVSVALRTLRKSGMSLLNQTVLLKDVNDDTDVLVGLSEALFENGVLPYYLHLLDKARGTSHFDLSTEEALKIYRTLRKSLPGYLLPKLVREEAGRPYKTPVG